MLTLIIALVAFAIIGVLAGLHFLGRKSSERSDGLGSYDDEIVDDNSIHRGR